MERHDQIKPSVYAGTAYELILTGVRKFQTEEDQRLLLDSLLCQCAVFARMFAGEQAFLELLSRLRNFDFDVEFDDPNQTH
ncbi:hypothetical protein [Pseudomonas putida]|uniref:hypothetical protein n=1 Tax=Pseudomonas putida TaxID=303 RepID=UPI003906C7AB